MSQKEIEHKNQTKIYNEDWQAEFNLDEYRRQSYENICLLIEELSLINPEVLFYHRPDLIEVVGDYARWRTDVLLQIPETDLRMIVNLAKKQSNNE